MLLQFPKQIHGGPFQPKETSMRVKELEEQLSLTHTSVICGFNQLLDLKDLNTGVHSTRLAEWGMRVGQELGVGAAQFFVGAAVQ